MGGDEWKGRRAWGRWGCATRGPARWARCTAPLPPAHVRASAACPPPQRCRRSAVRRLPTCPLSLCPPAHRPPAHLPCLRNRCPAELLQLLHRQRHAPPHAWLLAMDQAALSYCVNSRLDDVRFALTPQQTLALQALMVMEVQSRTVAPALGGAAAGPPAEQGRKEEGGGAAAVGRLSRYEPYAFPLLVESHVLGGASSSGGGGAAAAGDAGRAAATAAAATEGAGGGGDGAVAEGWDNGAVWVEVVVEEEGESEAEEGASSAALVASDSTFREVARADAVHGAEAAGGAGGQQRRRRRRVVPALLAAELLLDRHYQLCCGAGEAAQGGGVEGGGGGQPEGWRHAPWTPPRVARLLQCRWVCPVGLERCLRASRLWTEGVGRPARRATVPAKHRIATIRLVEAYAKVALLIGGGCGRACACAGAAGPWCPGGAGRWTWRCAASPAAGPFVEEGSVARRSKGQRRVPAWTDRPGVPARASPGGLSLVRPPSAPPAAAATRDNESHSPALVLMLTRRRWATCYTLASSR